MTKEEILNKKEYFTEEDMIELDKKYKFTPLTNPKVFRRVFTKNPDIFKSFLISILDLKLNPNKTKINIYNCRLSDNIVIMLNKNIFIEICFHKLDLYETQDEELPPQKSEEDYKKHEFLKRNNFNMKNAQIYYLFLTEEELSILKASLHVSNDE